MIKSPSVIFLTIFCLIFFHSCQTSFKKNSLPPEKQAELIARGKEITMQSFRAFSGELMKVLQEGGVMRAVGYCHLQASPIIDSLSSVYGVTVSRVSDKYRNPENKPGELDFTVLEAYRQQLAEGQELQPHLEITANEIVFYSPILVLNPACLQCHGVPGSTMEQENYDFIKTKYAGDLATGFKLGDLRGVWRIVFL